MVTLTIPDNQDASPDNDHFVISSGGVLSFKFSPDFEMPMGGDVTNTNTNTYKVVVVASDDAPGVGTEGMPIKMGYKKVTVTVTKVEEIETVTLSAEQGQIGVELTATYNDLDNEKPTDDTELTWKWYLGRSQIDDAGGTGAILTSAYIPANEGSLRAEASYTRTDGSTKAVSKTVNVRPVPGANNVAPSFGEGSGARSVDENSPPGTNVGKPVVAIDPTDKLTYTLDATSVDVC